MADVKYWVDRYKREGPEYVALGGRAIEYDRQELLAGPILQEETGTADRVLDVGCGPGRFEDYLGDDGSEYVGLDHIPTLGDVSSFEELEGREFDAVVAVWVLQHVTEYDEYRAMLNGVASVLRVGGVFVVIDEFRDTSIEYAAHMKPRGHMAASRILGAGFKLRPVPFAYRDSWAGVFERVG